MPFGHLHDDCARRQPLARWIGHDRLLVVASYFSKVAFDSKAGDDAVRILEFNPNVVDEIVAIGACEPTCDEQFTAFSRMVNGERLGASCAPLMMSIRIGPTSWNGPA